MNNDGASPVGLTNNTSPVQASAPVFSPDGRRIAFNQFDGTRRDIFAVNADGSAPVNLTNTPAPLTELDPDWQPIQRCGGKRVTLVGDDGPNRIMGTKKADVIDANGGTDVVNGRGGNDRICLGAGRDRASGGAGMDLCVGGKGHDKGGSCEKGKL